MYDATATGDVASPSPLTVLSAKCESHAKLVLNSCSKPAHDAFSLSFQCWPKKFSQKLRTQYENSARKNSFFLLFHKGLSTANLPSSSTLLPCSAPQLPVSSGICVISASGSKPKQRHLLPRRYNSTRAVNGKFRKWNYWEQKPRK